MLQEITNIRLRWFNLSANTVRVLWFYKFFGRAPVVVIRVPERQKGEPYAQVTSAVRGLADDFGLRVVVDGSPNSLPPEVNSTKRQLTMQVMPMERELIENITEFSMLMKFLKQHALDTGVWKVIGGCPQDYNMLSEIVSTLIIENHPTDKVVAEVKNHVHTILLEALNNNITKCSSNTDKILEIFQQNKICRISTRELKSKCLSLDYPNKVFREVEKDMHFFVEPASPAVGLIIEENIQTDDEVAKFVNKLFAKSKV